MDSWIRLEFAMLFHKSHNSYAQNQNNVANSELKMIPTKSMITRAEKKLEKGLGSAKSTV